MASCLVRGIEFCNTGLEKVWKRYGISLAQVRVNPVISTLIYNYVISCPYNAILYLIDILKDPIKQNKSVVMNGVIERYFDMFEEKYKPTSIDGFYQNEYNIKQFNDWKSYTRVRNKRFIPLSN